MNDRVSCVFKSKSFLLTYLVFKQLKFSVTVIGYSSPLVTHAWSSCCTMYIVYNPMITILFTIISKSNTPFSALP